MGTLWTPERIATPSAKRVNKKKQIFAVFPRILGMNMNDLLEKLNPNTIVLQRCVFELYPQKMFSISNNLA